MSVGLVLEGGAMRGMFTAGVLDIFIDNDIKADGVIGTSAGALFGVNYLSKQRGRAIRYNKKYACESRYMGVKSLITTGNIINKQFAYYDVPLKLDVFDQDTFAQSGVDFYATITNVETGEAEYVKITDIFEQMEILRATSAMPFVSQMVEVDGRKYLDGGIADSIPVEKCKELGYDKIIVVLTRTPEYRKKKSGASLAHAVYRRYPKLADRIANRYAEYNDCIEKIIEMEKRGEIFVIRPSRRVKIGRIERDPEKLQEMYDLGIEDGKKCIDDLKKYLDL